MQDRRNFYRVLHLQPDAPFELVRAHYRTLMTKLAAHLDLGGEDWSAAHLNAAYATLRDPGKREAYDVTLLEQYDVETLSLGGQSVKSPKRSVAGKRDPRVNERNYYRILGVQFDAPGAIIEASHKTLRKRADADHDLLADAFAVIGNASMRVVYDELLATHGHVEALGRLPQLEPEGTEEAKADAATPKEQTRTTDAPSSGYQPRISRYCAFCKTPFPASDSAIPYDRDCLECSSPLFAPPESLSELGRRVVDRIERDDRIELCIHWPGPATPGRLVDLSPTGLRCKTAWPLDVGERVKIASGRFLAVGEVAHRERVGDATLAGLRFLTVRFQEERGAFVSIEA